MCARRCRSLVRVPPHMTAEEVAEPATSPVLMPAHASRSHEDLSWGPCPRALFPAAPAESRSEVPLPSPPLLIPLSASTDSKPGRAETNARLFDLEADPVHALQLVRRQVDDEPRREVVQHSGERQRPERRLWRSCRRMVAVRHSSRLGASTARCESGETSVKRERREVEPTTKTTTTSRHVPDCPPSLFQSTILL